MKLVAAILLGCLLTKAAMTQASLIMPMGLTGKVMLLGMPDVKKEIKLTKDQEKAIQDLMKSMSSDSSSATAFPDMHYMTRGMDQKAVGLLSSVQASRLQELFLQINGLMALSEPEVSGPLLLSEETLRQVKTTLKEHDRAAMNVLVETQKTRKLNTKKLDELSKKCQEDLLALLTVEQKENWNKMLGEPFKFPKKR